jgi:hypothetical protein
MILKETNSNSYFIKLDDNISQVKRKLKKKSKLFGSREARQSLIILKYNINYLIYNFLFILNFYYQFSYQYC